jgi:undecaprenyl pyrophosphate phosphatase UppP
VIGGAALLECRDLEQFGDLRAMAIAVVMAMLSGWISVGLLLKIVNKNAWFGWGIYCIVAGLVYGAWLYV